MTNVMQVALETLTDGIVVEVIIVLQVLDSRYAMMATVQLQKDVTMVTQILVMAVMLLATRKLGIYALIVA